MAHLRRFDFKTRRYCSTPAVANLRDFTDSFVEDLKRKIAKSSNVDNNSSDNNKSVNNEKSTQDKINSKQKINQTTTFDNSNGSRMITTQMRKTHVISEEETADDEHDHDSHQDQHEHHYPTSSYHQMEGIEGLDELCLDEDTCFGQTASDQEQGAQLKSANWLSDSELIFSLNNQVGGLVRALRIFQVIKGLSLSLSLSLIVNFKLRAIK